MSMILKDLTSRLNRFLPIPTMIYEFRHPDGRLVEESFPIGTCPERIIVDGVVCERHFSVPIVLMEPSKPKTIGALADKNGREKEKREGKKDVKPRKKIDMSLAKMTAAQKDHYIRTGEKK